MGFYPTQYIPYFVVCVSWNGLQTYSGPVLDKQVWMGGLEVTQM